MGCFKSDISETAHERRLKQDLGRLNDALATEHNERMDTERRYQSLIERLEALVSEMKSPTSYVNPKWSFRVQQIIDEHKEGCRGNNRQ